MAVENEYKFTCDGYGNAEGLISELESFVVRKGVPYKKKVKSSVDYYYDDKDLSLYCADCCLRKKVSANGKIKLTAKRPISRGDGMLSREEIERTSDGTLKDLKAFCNEQFPSLDMEREPVLTAECERTAFDYQDGSELKLSFDVVNYVRGPLRYRFYEIELESMDDSECRDFDTIGLIPFITDHLGFEPATGSKYRRGVDWIDSTR
jgi:inorganic triphosphatase YgiF